MSDEQQEMMVKMAVLTEQVSNVKSDTLEIKQTLRGIAVLQETLIQHGGRLKALEDADAAISARQESHSQRMARMEERLDIDLKASDKKIDSRVDEVWSYARKSNEAQMEFQNQLRGGMRTLNWIMGLLGASIIAGLIWLISATLDAKNVNSTQQLEIMQQAKEISELRRIIGRDGK